MAKAVATILAAAGANGAGKTSIVQPFIERNGGAYFNPDRYAATLTGHGMPVDEANVAAWNRGFEQLRVAIEAGTAFAFETTLGGHSIPFQLMRALAFGRRVVILYVGLASPELHLQRIRERVAKGGHNIPEDKVRQRFDASRRNLLAFIGTDATIRVWDNSTQTANGRPTGAREIFRIDQRSLEIPPHANPNQIEGWARPLLAQAIRLGLR